ncbi:hypothetical protein [Mariprofundus sp. KV]|uniref:hypothetical protein n=1 Tax=Mariprofundus sp. KV TaxID=2608715 RepID=UPI0015A46040|nr:hypothetical protein [Mariprofundus sp. KV]NWF37238.1 hypothetical protein [Mariprofundus sp. KV]
MKTSPDAVQDQISGCLKALDGLNRCIRGRNWAKLGERDRALNSAMNQLQISVEKLPNLDDNLISQLQSLNLQFRRTQRKLSSLIRAAESDIASLEKGMRKVAMIREALDG